MSSPSPNSALAPPLSASSALQKRPLASTTVPPVSPSEAPSDAERKTVEHGDQPEPKRKKRKKGGHRKDINKYARYATYYLVL